MTVEEAAGFLLRLLGFAGKIEGYERITGEKMTERRGLACLSRPGEDDDWPRSGGMLQARLDRTRDPHMQNIRQDRIFCIDFCLLQLEPKSLVWARSADGGYFGEAAVDGGCTGGAGDEGEQGFGGGRVWHVRLPFLDSSSMLVG